MKIFAIIVTYNAMRRSWIEKCLKSLQTSTVPVTSIVIDNGSTDETRCFVPEHFPDAIWLPQEKNLGFGQANNIGLRYALEHEADYVLLLNQDATIGTDALEKMVPLCDDHTLMSPLHLNGDGTRLDAGFKYGLSLRENHLLDDLLIGTKLQPTYDSLYPAACWFIPIAIIKSVGSFNPLFFHYGEDDNYMHRLEYHGIRTRICPVARMCHDRGERGDLKLFHHHYSRRSLLEAATNINNSFSKSLLEWIKIIKNNFTKHQYRMGSSSSDLLWLIAHSYQIWASRKKEKTVGTTWL